MEIREYRTYNEAEILHLYGSVGWTAYVNDFSDTRMHHEIYLSDARKVAPEKWKTVIRHPARKKV